MSRISKPASIHPALTGRRGWPRARDGEVANALLNNPTAAPGYNYTFGRSDNTIKIGVNVHLHK